MVNPTSAAVDAATTIFNLPDYTVVSAVVLAFGQRRITVESTLPLGCPACGAASVRRKERRVQRLRDTPVAGPIELVWAKRRFFCDEQKCARKSFTETTGQVPKYARSTARLKDALVTAVINSGRAISETAAAFGISWWLVQDAVNHAAVTLPDVDQLAPRHLGIDEHRYRSVRFFQGPATKTWTRYEPWMSTIVDLDTGQVLGIVDGRDSTGIGDWLFNRPLAWRLNVQVVAIDPSAAFRKALRMWLPRAAVSVDHFHLTMLANQAITDVRQRLTQETKGRRGRASDPVWANRRLLLKAEDKLSTRAANRLETVFAVDDPTGKLEAAWRVKEQVRTMLRAGSLADLEADKQKLHALVEAAGQPETDRLWRTIRRWSAEIEVLIVPVPPPPKWKPTIRPSNRSKGQAAATATQKTTNRVSCLPVPPGRRHDTHLNTQFLTNREGLSL